VSSSIDVVVVAYGHYDLTSKCLRHLQAQTVAHHVIVVDNGSTDDTRARLRSEWPAVQLECIDENRGFPKACNQGVAAGSGEIVVLLNNDVDCRPDFLERLIAPLEDPRVGSVASLVLARDERSIDSFGIAADVTLAGFQRLHGMPLERIADRLPLAVGPEGTAGAYRRSAWEQVGGLDEAIPAYMDVLDLAAAGRRLGDGLRTAGGRRAPGLGDVWLPVASAAPPRGLRARLCAAPLRRAARARVAAGAADRVARGARRRARLPRPGRPARARRGLARSWRPGAPPAAARRLDRHGHHVLGLVGPAAIDPARRRVISSSSSRGTAPSSKRPRQ
jgi:hypothetical protein